MSGAKFTTLLEGVPRLVRQIQLADTATRERTIAAVQRGTKRVAASARARAPKASGEMASTIRDEYSKDGLVGFVKVGLGKLARRSRASSAAAKDRLAKKRSARARARGKGRMPVIEHGDPRRHRTANPFVIPALVGERDAIIADLAKATVDGGRTAGLT